MRRTLPVCGFFVNKYELSLQVNTGAQVVIALSKSAICGCPFFGQASGQFNLYRLDKPNGSITFINRIWMRGISLLANFE